MNCEGSHYVHWRDVDSCASNLHSQEMCTADISNSQCEVCMNNNCEKCRLIGCDVCFPNACKHPLFPLSILLQVTERDLWIKKNLGDVFLGGCCCCCCCGMFCLKTKYKT